MQYSLTLANDADQAIALKGSSSGVIYEMGCEVDRQLRRHPLATSELGRPKRVDAIHLSIIDGRKDLIRWMGRGPDGYYRQIGRAMKLIDNSGDDNA